MKNWLLTLIIHGMEAPWLSKESISHTVYSQWAVVPKSIGKKNIPLTF